MEIYIRLNEILEERNMTQKQLADITGLRPATISEMCNNQRSVMNKEHLLKVFQALNLNNLNELITLKTN